MRRIFVLGDGEGTFIKTAVHIDAESGGVLLPTRKLSQAKQFPDRPSAEEYRTGNAIPSLFEPFEIHYTEKEGSKE